MRGKVVRSIVLTLGGMLFVLSVIALIKIVPIVQDGYDMYKEAVTAESLQSRIDKIRQEENYVKIDEISESYLEDVVQSEDHRFYMHHGVDPIAIMRALYQDIKVGSFVQGGSTITQQLAKNLCFDFDKNLARKVAEIFVANELEDNLTKDEILELYCNVAYYGEGCYGIEEASTHYYGVKATELTEEQSKVLTKTLKAPSYNNPNQLKLAGN